MPMNTMPGMSRHDARRTTRANTPQAIQTADSKSTNTGFGGRRPICGRGASSGSTLRLGPAGTVPLGVARPEWPGAFFFFFLAGTRRTVSAGHRAGQGLPWPVVAGTNGGPSPGQA